MTNKLNEKEYLNYLKESLSFSVKEYENIIDFSNNPIYVGTESVGDILVEEGIIKNYLEEGILTIPIDKLKQIFSKLMINSSTIEGLKNTEKIFGGIAKKIKGTEIPKKIIQIAETKGISDSQVNSSFEQILRMLGLLQIGFYFLAPITWIIVLIALAKSGSFDDFQKHLKSATDELLNSIDKKDSNFEKSMMLQSLVLKLLLACLIPPWIQGVILTPIILVLMLIAYLQFIVEFLKQFG
jgi:hypothetical protein